MTKFQKIFDDIKHTRDYKTVGEDIQYKVTVDDKDKTVTLQFEESTSRKDWVHNISFIPVPLKLCGHWVWVTRGYACAYKSASNLPIMTFYTKAMEHPDYARIIRGWSFGSAMSKIATRHFFYLTGAKINALITYGDVKCFLNPFIGKIAHKYADLIYNFVTPNDFVTWQVPFIYHRMNKCTVENKLKIKELFKTEYYHTHYEEYDYSKYE